MPLYMLTFHHQGVKNYPTVILTYPNVRDCMISGNFYNQVISLREQIYKELGEPIPNNIVKPWVPLLNTDGKIELLIAQTCEVSGATLLHETPLPNEHVEDCTAVLSQFWYPGQMRIGSFIEATVELRRIDHGTIEPKNVYYSIIAEHVNVLAHEVDLLVGIKSAIHYTSCLSLPPEMWSSIISFVIDWKDVLSFALSSKSMYDIALPFLAIDIHVRREIETHHKIQHVSSNPIANLHRVHSIHFHPILPTRLTPYEDCPICSTDDQCVHKFDGVFTVWTDILPLFASLHRIELSCVRLGIAVYDALSNIRNPFTLIIADCVIPLPPIQRSCDLLCDNLHLARNDWEVIVHRTHSFDFAFIALCENLSTLDLTFDDRIHGSRQTTIDHISPLTTTLRSLTLRSTISSPRALTSFIDSMLAAVVQNIVKVHIIIVPDHQKVALPTKLSHLTNASNLTTLSLKVDNDLGSLPYLPSLKRLSINVSTDPSYLLHLIPMFFTGLCHLELGTFGTDSYLDLCICISHSKLQFIPTLCDLKILISTVNRDTNAGHIALLFRPWLSTAPNLQNINFADSVFLRRSTYHWIASTAHV